MNEHADETNRNQKFLNQLDVLLQQFDATRMDRNALYYKVLSDTQLAYFYTDMVSQCKMLNHLPLSEYIGRPSFLRTEQQIATRLKRRHPFKTVPLHLKRLEAIIELRLIEKIPFQKIKPALLALLDEKTLSQKPDLYIFPSISTAQMKNIPYADIDFNSINVKLLSQKEMETKKLEHVKKGKVKAAQKETNNGKVAAQSNPTLIKEQKILSSKSGNPATNSSDPLSSSLDSLRIQLLSYDNRKRYEKLKELSDFNIATIKSQKTFSSYKELGDFLTQKSLLPFYSVVLQYNLQLKRLFFFEYKKKPVFHIDSESLAMLYYSLSDKKITNKEAIALLDALCEIGLLRKIPHTTLATDLGIPNNQLELLLEKDGFSDFSRQKSFYIIVRFNQPLLKRANESVIEMSRHTTSDDKTVSPVNEKAAKKEESVSVTSCAIEIMSNYEVQGDKVIIEKSAFDKLIQAILRESSS